MKLASTTNTNRKFGKRRDLQFHFKVQQISPKNTNPQTAVNPPSHV
jgi:hypothetical protein